MARKRNSCIAVPDVQDSIDLEDKIKEMRSSVRSDCIRLLKVAKGIDRERPRNNAFRFAYWESEINKIRTAERNTYSLDELSGLRKKCEKVLERMEKFIR